MERFTSLLGIGVMLLLAWSMSSYRGRIPWRTILGGLSLQLLLALFILKTEAGQQLFKLINFVFVALLDCVDAGSQFVFGSDFQQHYFAFKILPTIIFFSAFMSIFYYYGVMQLIVGLMAKVMQRTLKTSGAETLSAAANVFVGQTEAPLVIRPYISTMTVSELNAVMVGGFATMAGGVLGGLAGMGIDAGQLLAAAVISAPGALLMAKIMQPEVDSPQTMGTVRLEVEDKNENVLEAIASGTISGLQLALNVGAMLIVFTALIAVVNSLLGAAGGSWLGSQISNLFSSMFNTEVGTNWSLEAILGFLFFPFAWLIGVEYGDCSKAAELMGLKLATNEFFAYGRMAEWPTGQVAGDGGVITERTRTLMTFALSGFANFASIGIQLGGIGGIAPERRAELARLGLRAMLGGLLTGFMTAAIAALFI